jgi:hypothetical protein
MSSGRVRTRVAPEREHPSTDDGHRRAQVERVSQAFAKVADLLERHGQPSSRVYRAVADFAAGLRAPFDDQELRDLKALATGVPRIPLPAHSSFPGNGSQEAGDGHQEPDDGLQDPGDGPQEPWQTELIRQAHQAAAAAYALRT